MAKPKLLDKNFSWTPNLAYAIGLLTTDGCLSTDKRHIIMRSSEPELLKTFKQCLNIDNKIGTTKNGNIISYRVQFGSVQFYNWLIKIGLFPAKTYTIGEINVPDKYFKDFLKGHLDGDGNISTYQDKYNTFKNPKYIYIRLWVRFISASKKHMLWLQDSMKRNLDVVGSIHEAKPANPEKQVSIWVLKFGKKESNKLLSQLYYQNNLPSLARKRKIAEKFIGAYN